LGTPRDRGPIGLIATGGTIGSERAGEEVRLRTEGGEAPPELSAVVADNGSSVQAVQPLRKLSENMVPSDWVIIANAIVDLVEGSDASGVVVLHGTDTAAYTAAALSFLTVDLEAPIVLTGSNLPATEPHSDAPTNVRDAIVAASSLGCGTYLSFSGVPGKPSWIHLGTNVRKVASGGQAFSSLKGEPVASIEDGRFTQHKPVNIPRSSSYLRDVDDRVLAFSLYPGIDLQLLADAAVQGRTRGIVVELYPTGAGPTVQGTSSLPEFVRRCDQNGIVVVTTASTLPGTHASMYETFVAIRESGALFASNLIFEAAISKMMWVLAQSQSIDEVKELLLQPVVEEYYGTVGDH
jgi:L-asparaginase